MLHVYETFFSCNHLVLDIKELCNFKNFCLLHKKVLFEVLITFCEKSTSFNLIIEIFNDEEFYKMLIWLQLHLSTPRSKVRMRRAVLLHKQPTTFKTWNLIKSPSAYKQHQEFTFEEQKQKPRENKFQKQQTFYKT